MSLTEIKDVAASHSTSRAATHLTHVGEYDERATAEAIRRELLREETETLRS